MYGSQNVRDEEGMEENLPSDETPLLLPGAGNTTALFKIVDLRDDAVATVRHPAIFKIALLAGLLIIVALFATFSRVNHLRREAYGDASVIGFFDDDGYVPRVFADLDEDELKDLFDEFIKKYSKRYNNKVYHKRFEYFKSNLKEVDLRNTREREAGGSAKFGITKFSDLSYPEFKQKYLMNFDKGYKPEGKPTIPYANFEYAKTVDPTTSRNTLIVDWSERGYTTPVESQGSNCAGSWAFAAIEQIESDAIRVGLSLDDASAGSGGDDNAVDDYVTNTASLLSVQQILTCTSVNTIVQDSDDDDDDDDDWKGWYNGCTYGSIEEAFKYAVDSTQAVQSAKTKPYLPNDVLWQSEECLNRAYGYESGWVDYYSYYYYSDDKLSFSDDRNNDDWTRYRNRTGIMDDDGDDDDDDDDDASAGSADEDNCAVHVEHWASLSPQAWKGDDAYLIRDDSDIAVEADMLVYLLNRGPLAVCIDATMWMSYVAGTMFECGNIATTNINHCVQVVGVTYNAKNNIGYYKVRNSWGSDWGDAGYIYLAFGHNTCGIRFNPSFTEPHHCPARTDSGPTADGVKSNIGRKQRRQRQRQRRKASAADEDEMDAEEEEEGQREGARQGRGKGQKTASRRRRA